MNKNLSAAVILLLLLAVGWLGARALDIRRPKPRPAPAPPASVPVPAPEKPAAFVSDPPASLSASTAEIEAVRSEARAREAAGDFEGAITVVRLKLQEFPQDQLLARDLSHLFAVRGWQRRDAHDLSSARGFFKEALFYWPGNQEAMRGLAFISAEEQDRPQAEEWVRRYFAAGGDRPEVYALQGRIAYEDERLTEALYYFEASLALDPRQTEVAAMVEKIRRERRVESGFARRDTRHFVIKYEGQELPGVWRLVETVCEEAYLEVGRKLGHYPELPVTVILYTDRQFQDATRSPAWAEAIFDGKIRIPAKGLMAKNDELVRIVMHEYAHAVVHDLARGRAPIWLHEGVAQSCEGTPTDVGFVARRIVAGGGPLPLTAIEGMFVTMPQKQAELAYIQSRLAAIYLNETGGPFVLRELLRRLGEGGSLAEAVRGATGLAYPDLDADFQEWVRQAAGPHNP